MDMILAILIRLIFWAMRLIPVRIAGAIGAGLGRIGYMLDAHHRNVALHNLARVYPEKEEAWRVRIARESFAELGRTLFELPHVFLRSKNFLLSRIRVEGEEHLRNALALNRGAFITACHHSNWELGGLAFSMLGYPSSVIYRPMKQLSVEAFLKSSRERFGATFRSRLNHNIRWIPKTLKESGVIAVMVDQCINTGMPVPFLGHPANTTTVPAVFAMKQNTPIIGAALERDGRRFAFTLRIWPIPQPQADDGREISVYDHMLAVNQSFDDIIKRRPELWIWSHRRWRNLDEPELFNGTSQTA